MRYRFFEWNLLWNSPVWQWISVEPHEFYENKHTLSKWMENEKPISESNVNRNHAKIRNHKKTLSVQGQKKSFTDVLYSTLSLKTRSFTFWFTSLKHASLAWTYVRKYVCTDGWWRHGYKTKILASMGYHIFLTMARSLLNPVDLNAHQIIFISTWKCRFRFSCFTGLGSFTYKSKK